VRGTSALGTGGGPELELALLSSRKWAELAEERGGSSLGTSPGRSRRPGKPRPPKACELTVEHRNTVSTDRRPGPDMFDSSRTWLPVDVRPFYPQDSQFSHARHRKLLRRAVERAHRLTNTEVVVFAMRAATVRSRGTHVVEHATFHAKVVQRCRPERALPTARRGGCPGSMPRKAHSGHRTATRSLRHNVYTAEYSQRPTARDCRPRWCQGTRGWHPS